jgi:hypothetical protein
MIPLPIANGFYVSDSLPLSAQECVNVYPSLPEVPALSQETLLGTPGTELLATAGLNDRINRGAWVLAGVPYFVCGGFLYRLTRSLSVSTYVHSMQNLGAITGEGRVSMADNGTQLCIVVPGNPSTGYIFTADPDTLTTITDPDFKANGEPQRVVFIDGYFAFTTDTKKFVVSELNDGLSYNALDFASAEADPDPAVVPLNFGNELYIAGSQTIEAFQNIGGAQFPFQRTGLVIPKGVSAPSSAINTSLGFMFIGAGKDESPAIWALSGNTVEKVSTIAIDSILQRLSADDLANSFAYSYAQKGAYFCCFSLPERTLVFDTISKRWHERKSQIVDARGITRLVRSRVNSLVSAYGLVLVGDAIDGRIGSLTPDIFTEYGAPIVRRFATQPFQSQGNSFSVPAIELTVESGVGSSVCPDPKIRMDRSIDGKTWSDERTRSIGKVGQYSHRAIWRRNGRAARFEVFRFTMSDPVKPVFIQLMADIV